MNNDRVHYYDIYFTKKKKKSHKGKSKAISLFFPFFFLFFLALNLNCTWQTEILAVCAKQRKEWKQYFLCSWQFLRSLTLLDKSRFKTVDINIRIIEMANI